MRDGKEVQAGRHSTRPEDISVLWKAFDDVSAEYLVSEVGRRPTLSELLACLAFVLRVEGTRYLSGVPEELDIERIVLVGEKS